MERALMRLRDNQFAYAMPRQDYWMPIPVGEQRVLETAADSQYPIVAYERI